uniref:SH3 domain-containing protein n=1 Tax=Amphiprion ocellaris TaxID=80972 RepID=A0AAQ5Y830_AMPOC
MRISYSFLCFSVDVRPGVTAEMDGVSLTYTLAAITSRRREARGGFGQRRAGRCQTLGGRLGERTRGWSFVSWEWTVQAGRAHSWTSAGNWGSRHGGRSKGLVLYKEDFEKNKGRGFSVVTDTPEMQRLKKTQDQISNIKYHEVFEKTKMGGEVPHHQPSNPSPAAYQVSAASQNFHYDPAPEPVRQAAAAPPPSAGKRYRAVYDYSAADEDEVSFVDGDVIVDVQQIDEGWMYGRVERTGQQGMLPANYVEAV